MDVGKPVIVCAASFVDVVSVFPRDVVVCDDVDNILGISFDDEDNVSLVVTPPACSTVEMDAVSCPTDAVDAVVGALDDITVV